MSVKPLCIFLTLLFSSFIYGSHHQPNIIFIVSDDQGYSDLGFLNPEVKTPHLDRLAKEGVYLKNFYVTWPACTPSRGSMLTGRYPQRNGTYDMFRNEAPDFGYLYKSREEYDVTWEFIGGMDTREVLVSDYLKDKGYTNGLFGKWDLGALKRYLPLQRGFHDFYGFVNSSVDYFTHERYGVHAMYRNNKPSYEDQGTYCTDLFEREALRFIDQNHKKPFFLFLPFNAPHAASNLDLSIRTAAQAKPEDIDQFPELKKVAGYVKKYNKRYQKDYQAPDKTMQRLLYLASIYSMDRAIGRVLEKLDHYQIRNNTFIFFISDNGGGSGSNNHPLKGKKGTLYEGGIRVPAIASYPNGLPKNIVNDEFLSSLEVLPTFLNLAQAKHRKDIKLDGFDMLPVLKGEKKSPREKMFWKRRNHIALIVNDYKYIQYGNKKYLYNLENDLSEKKNLIQQEPEVLKKCEDLVYDWLKEMDQAEPRGPFRNY